MRAAVIHRYGDASELTLADVSPARLGRGQVRLAVHASSVNPVDVKIRAGGQRAVIWPRFPATLGMDVSGVVLETGPGVTGFSPGDAVYGSPSHRTMGCHAEQVVAAADELAPKPERLTHAEAASLPLVALTAWDAFEAMRVCAGQRVLITGGSGGVGTAAIQLARSFGARVLTTCSAANVELVRGLGAETVIDYRAERFEEVARGVDCALETVGGADVMRAVRTVRRGGRVAYITAGLPVATAQHGPALGVLSVAVRQLGLKVAARLRGRALFFVTRRPSGAALRRLNVLIEAGALRPVIDRVYPLEQIADAHRHVETGRTRGKVVIAVRPGA